MNYIVDFVIPFETSRKREVVVASSLDNLLDGAFTKFDTLYKFRNMSVSRDDAEVLLCLIDSTLGLCCLVSGADQFALISETSVLTAFLAFRVVPKTDVGSAHHFRLYRKAEVNGSLTAFGSPASWKFVHNEIGLFKTGEDSDPNRTECFFVDKGIPLLRGISLFGELTAHDHEGCVDWFKGTLGTLWTKDGAAKRVGSKFLTAGTLASYPVSKIVIPAGAPAYPFAHLVTALSGRATETLKQTDYPQYANSLATATTPTVFIGALQNQYENYWSTKVTNRDPEEQYIVPGVQKKVNWCYRLKSEAELKPLGLFLVCDNQSPFHHVLARDHRSPIRATKDEILQLFDLHCFLAEGGAPNHDDVDPDFGDNELFQLVSLVYNVLHNCPCFADVDGSMLDSWRSTLDSILSTLSEHKYERHHPKHPQCVTDVTELTEDVVRTFPSEALEAVGWCNPRMQFSAIEPLLARLSSSLLSSFALNFTFNAL